MSPSRFRFKKFSNVKLGVIHPEEFSAEEARSKKQLQRKTGPPEYIIYRPGDEHFMEVRGKSCPKTSIVPNVIYTEKDKAELPEHLVEPFLFVTKIKGKEKEEAEERKGKFKRKRVEHPMHTDVFIYFEKLAESWRKNNNLYKDDYRQILKGMTQEEREKFYKRSTVSLNVLTPPR